MCVLFTSHLLLATSYNEGRKFTVVFIIRASDMRLESADNAAGSYIPYRKSDVFAHCSRESSGLKCVKTPFSFKIIYGTIGSTFELVVSACSMDEKTRWKDQILEQLGPGVEPTSPRDLTMANLPLKPLCQISAGETIKASDRITLRIKGIEAIQRSNHTSTSSLGKPQPTQKNTGNTVVLSPKRQDRIRMERCISSIWTCDVISYPGMVVGKGEYFFRSSAESFIRRLSSRRPFTRRSSSLTTINTTRSAEARLASKVDLSIDEKDTAELASSEIQEEKMVVDGDSFKTAEEAMGASPGQTTTTVTTSPGLTERANGNINPEKDAKTGKKKKWSVSLFKTMSPVKPRRSWPIEV